MTENWLLFAFACLIALVTVVRQVLAYRKALRTPAARRQAAKTTGGEK